VIAVTQACCQAVLQSSTEQCKMHFAQTSAAVHFCRLYEEQISIGVIAVTQACCEPNDTLHICCSMSLCTLAASRDCLNSKTKPTHAWHLTVRAMVNNGVSNHAKHRMELVRMWKLQAKTASRSKRVFLHNI